MLPSQGSKSSRKSKYNYADYYKTRKAAKQALNNERSLRNDIGRPSTYASFARVEERTRRIISYGHPEFQIDDMVKILKDTAPGTLPRFSYDKLGVIKNVIDGNGSNANLYTVKILFESCTEEVDEMW